MATVIVAMGAAAPLLEHIVASDNIKATMTVMREEHLWNVSVLQIVHLAILLLCELAFDVIRKIMKRRDFVKIMTVTADRIVR
jgi:hypothetical protein